MPEPDHERSAGPVNTILTAEQLDIEQRAAALLADPATRAVRDEVAARWIAAKKPAAALQGVFAAEFEQIAFCSAMNAFNADPAHPRIHAFGRFEHEASGVRIPGTKSGSPCPDYVYRFIPVDALNHYVIHGRAPPDPSVAFEFGVIDAQQLYQGTVSAHELVIDREGRFRITIDPNPAAGRANHIQSKPGACQVIVRDVLGDVARHRPYALQVERVGPGPVAAPLEQDPVQRFGRELRKFVDDLDAAIAMTVLNREVNRFESPVFHDDGTYLVTQAYTPGRYVLRDDEALVFHLGLGNAAYAVIPATNWWGGVGDFLAHIGTLGTGRAAANPDGTFTFVLSLSDPGVRNWIDPAGQDNGIVYARWAGFDPRNTGSGRPSLSTRLVKLSELGDALPPGCPESSAQQRFEQITTHRADYLAALG